MAHLKMPGNGSLTFHSGGGHSGHHWCSGRGSQVSLRSKRFVGAGALGCALLSLLTPTASADHVQDTYRQRGYIWFAHFQDNAIAWVSSDNCNPRELEAYGRTEATTAGEFPARWPRGIRMSRHDDHPCDGHITPSVDIEIVYEPSSNFNNNSYGGYNVSILAKESWCEIWNRRHPCGTHPSYVHLNQARFGNSPYSDHYRRRLIMHETGHSLGMAHHCSTDAIMNDGTSDCNGGAWTNINGYRQPDLDAIHNVYPNWMY